MAEHATPQLTFKDAWKEYAQAPPLTTNTTIRVALPRDYRNSYLANACKKAGKAEKDFLSGALVAWYEAHKNAKTPAGDDVLQRIDSNVPKPRDDEVQTAVNLVGEPTLKEGPLARVIDVRFGLTDAGRNLAAREAILMALNATFGTKL
jgi:hypothetical protein